MAPKPLRGVQAFLLFAFLAASALAQEVVVPGKTGKVRIGQGPAGTIGGPSAASNGGVSVVPGLGLGLSPPPGAVMAPTPHQLAIDMQSHIAGLTPLIKDTGAVGAALRLRVLAADAGPAQAYAAMVLLRALSRPERMAGLESYLNGDESGRAVLANLQEWSAAIDTDSSGRAKLASALAQLKQGGGAEARALEVLFDGSLGRAAETGVGPEKKIAAARLAPATPGPAPPSLFKNVPPVASAEPSAANVDLPGKPYPPALGVKLVEGLIKQNKPYRYRTTSGDWLNLYDRYGNHLYHLRGIVEMGDLVVYKGDDGELFLASQANSALRPYEAELAALISAGRAHKRDLQEARSAFKSVRDQAGYSDIAGPLIDALTARERFDERRRSWREKSKALVDRAEPPRSIARFLSEAWGSSAERAPRLIELFLRHTAATADPNNDRPDIYFNILLPDRLYYQLPGGAPAPMDRADFSTADFSTLVKTKTVTVRIYKDGYVLASKDDSPLKAHEEKLAELTAQSKSLRQRLEDELEPIIDLMSGKRGKPDMPGAIAAAAKLKTNFEARHSAWQGERDALLLAAGDDNAVRGLLQAVLAHADPAGGLEDISLSALLEEKFKTADALLAALYPGQIAALLKFFPQLPRIGVSDFEQSLFIDPDMVRQLVENRKRFKDAQAPAQNGKLHELGFIIARGDDEFSMAGFKTGDYLLPYQVHGLENLAAYAAPQKLHAVFVPDTTRGERKARLKRRFHVFNELIETNFRVLPMMNGLSSLPKSAARAIVAEVEVMVAHYEALTLSAGRADEGEEVRKRYDAIVAEVEGLWKDASEIAPLPAAVAERLGKMEVGARLADIKNLHTLVNYMHQKSFSALGADTKSGGKAGGRLIASNNIPFMYLGDEPLIKNRRLQSKPLAALLNMDRRPAEHQTDTVIVHGDEAWAHANLGAHSAEIYVKFASPDDGGMLRMRYQEGDNTPKGNPLRLALVKEELARLGVHGEEDGPQHLNAVIDKDHGLSSESRLEELFPVVLQALHSTLDMNLGFERMSLKDGHALIPGLAEMYLAEGRWLSRDWINSTEFTKNYAQYTAAEAQARRFSVRATLDSELGRLGLPPIPADIAFGQAAIDRHFTQAVSAALIRGQLRRDEKGIPQQTGYRPVVDLAAATLKDPGSAARMASVLSQLGADIEYEPIGAVGALRAERAHWKLGAQTLVLHALREAETGQLGYARIQAYHPAGDLKELSPEELEGLLRRRGQKAPAAAPLSGAQMAALKRLLRAPAASESLSGQRVEGLAASPGQGGFVTAAVTFKREGRTGEVLLVPFTTPEDIDAIKRSAAVITTGGGLLSHAAITTRELGIQSAILPAASWKKDNAGGSFLEITAYNPQPALAGPGGLRLSPGLEVRRLTLREGDLVRVNGATGELSLFVEDGAALASGQSFLKEGRGGPLTAAAVRFVVEEALLNASHAGRRAELIVSLLSREAAESGAARAHGRRVLESKAAQSLTRLADNDAPSAAALQAAEKDTAQLTELAALFGIETTMLEPLKAKSAALRQALATRQGAELDGLTREGVRLLAQSNAGEQLAPLRRAIKRLELALPAGTPPETPAKILLTLRRREAELAAKKRAAIARMAPAVLPLGAVDDDYRGLVGGKLSKLGEILAVVREHGAYVPEAIAATTAAYQRFLKENGLDKPLQALAKELDKALADTRLSEETRQNEINRLSQRIRALLLSGRLDPQKGLGRELWEAMKARGLDNPRKRLAVRSSAVQEDQSDAAFAGAAESYLHVKPEEVLQKVVENWSSFWLPRGIVYRHEHGVASVDLLPATIIQEMAEADVAGVIFTQNPVTGDDEIVIASAFGLGEGIVSGIVQTDRYVVRSSDGSETRLPFLGDKRIAVMPKAGASGTELRGVEKAKRRQRSLTPAQTFTLSKIAAALEEHFGYPLDIEFAVKGDRIAMLQARPVTSRS